MKRKFYFKNLLFFTSLVVVILTATMVISLSESKDNKESPMKCEYIEVYYTSPLIMPYVPITKDDIEKRAVSKIIIGDVPKMEEINKILNSIVGKKEDSVGIADSLTFKIKIKSTDGKTEIWVVDKSRNFELDNKERGKMPYEVFEELVHIFDSCVKIVDLKYLENIKSEGKIQIK